MQFFFSSYSHPPHTPPLPSARAHAPPRSQPDLSARYCNLTHIHGMRKHLVFVLYKIKSFATVCLFLMQPHLLKHKKKVFPQIFYNNNIFTGGWGKDTFSCHPVHTDSFKLYSVLYIHHESKVWTHLLMHFCFLSTLQSDTWARYVIMQKRKTR